MTRFDIGIDREVLIRYGAVPDFVVTLAFSNHGAAGIVQDLFYRARISSHLAVDADAIEVLGMNVNRQFALGLPIQKMSIKLQHFWDQDP